MLNSLPNFERPPITEVAIGVQFEPLQKLRAAHFGVYWSKIRDRYPNSLDQPQLPPNFEPSPNEPPIRVLPVQQGIPLRCCFLDLGGNEFIQLQNDRFIRNWRQVKGDEPYPRYQRLVGKFKDEWTTFFAFLNDQNIGEAKVNQCELSYVNNLEPGKGWNSFSDLASVFTTLQAPKKGILPEPELFSWESRYKMPENKGVLHVRAQPVFRARDFKLVLAFSFTARGPANGSEVFAWFSLAHEWIVSGFDELTRPAIQDFWGKTKCTT